MKELVLEGMTIILAIFIASLITGNSAGTDSMKSTTGNIMKEQVTYLKRIP